ncbi:tRNA pseudouridine(38-40) synthase TruA [Trueperella pecoris]|uniref:tRNA pseudouridine synthase A n=1 Tax=Trueperella pecoris TaxID=2733571 RepID=A0A7M1QTI1_9ACTO|nr:tRNA pseudouridine(38-40) synthase TruA [Trueperella pecoris]QOR45111.1 tRNA pseudouridine(38-40) synthase TruA [Trueperella pecoris]QTG75018.1 tRNA pseudouridine(38-40) synthase TruA [Trueperella pecoris]
MRIRIDLSYDGAAFHGWAAQPGLRTVQGELEKALATVLRQPVALTVAGRTDAGVHAAGQCAHFDVDAAAWAALPGRSSREPGESLVRKINAITSRGADGPVGFSDVVVKRADVVGDDFDARFSALWRRYSYRIADGVENWDPRRKDVLWLDGALDVAAMNRAAQALLGEHDFLSFCKPREGASTVRTLLELGFVRDGGVVTGYAKADAFCHSQVRTLMGSLIEVGRGARDEDWPAARLEAAVRNGEVIVAPPHPLTLEEIGYPAPAEYGAQAVLARRYRG